MQGDAIEVVTRSGQKIYGTDSVPVARVTPMLGPGRIDAAYSMTF